MPFGGVIADKKKTLSDYQSILTDVGNTKLKMKNYPIRKADKRASCAIVIHCHTPELLEMEKFSLDYSMAILGDRDYFFILPESIDAAYYSKNFKQASIVRFADQYFKSREAYSQLYLSDMFYQHFASTHEFVLILQTDAIVFRDELDYWCSQPWDYIGAPWPTKILPPDEILPVYKVDLCPGKPVKQGMPCRAGDREFVLGLDCFESGDLQR